MKFATSILACGLVFFCASGAFAQGDTKGWQEYEKFVRERYLQPAIEKLYQKKIAEEFEEQGRPGGWERQAEISKWARETATRELNSDHVFMSKLFGYALGNQMQKIPSDSLFHPVMKELEKQALLALLKYAKAPLKGRIPFRTEAEIKKKHESLQRYAKNAIQGDHDEDMARRTGVESKSAPDYFEFQALKTITGEWAVIDFGSGTKKIVGKWTLTKVKGKHGYKAESKTLPGREWRVLEGFIIWMTTDGTPKALFFGGGKSYYGLTLKAEESKFISKNNKLPKTKNLDIGKRMTIRMQRPMDPDTVLGNWGYGLSKREEGRAALEIKIESVPGKPGHYVGKIVRMGEGQKDGYPGGVGMEIIRLRYDKDRSIKDAMYYVNVTRYSQYEKEQGNNPWVENKWVRIMGKRLGGRASLHWMRK